MCGRCRVESSFQDFVDNNFYCDIYYFTSISIFLFFFISMAEFILFREKLMKSSWKMCQC